MHGTDDTRERLRQAARDTLLETGLAGFSMRRVATACGVSATAIYRHYADKDALVGAAVVEGFRTFGQYLLSALEQPTPSARFRHLGQRYFDFAQDHRADYQLIFMTDCKALGLSKLNDDSQRQVGGTFQLLQDRIADCQRCGDFRTGDPRELAAFVWACVHGLASLLVTGNLGADAIERAALVTQHLDLLEASLKA